MYLLGQNRGYSSNVVDTNAGNIDYVPNGVEGNTVYLDTTNGLIDYVVIPPFYSNVTLGTLTVIAVSIIPKPPVVFFFSVNTVVPSF